MDIELLDAERIILEEIANKDFHQKDIAVTYTFVIKQCRNVDVSKINQAIIERWSLTGLKKIKTLAWKMIEGK